MAHLDVPQFGRASNQRANQRERDATPLLHPDPVAGADQLDGTFRAGNPLFVIR
jgi:hypothetical protein